MPSTVSLRHIVLSALIAIAPALPALASDTPASAAKVADRKHPQADKINQANSRVIHAGPGQPLTGAIFTPPAPGKKDKKN